MLLAAHGGSTASRRGRAEAPPAGYGAGAAPSCCISPSMSALSRRSTNFPSLIRSMDVPVKEMRRPVAGMPMNGPVCSASKVQRHDLVALRELLVDGESGAGERRQEARGHLLEAIALRGQARRCAVPHPVRGEELVDGVHVAVTVTRRPCSMATPDMPDR
jgi:hypothetical protein